MVLNQTNAKLIAQITGSEETEEWNGHQVVCYNEPSIAFAGKITGGIRVRAPKKQPPRPVPVPAPAPPRPPKPSPAEQYLGADESDDVPF
jgi:hypothetical protein